MDAMRFDGLARALAARLPRRLAGRLIGGGLVAALGLRLLPERAAARTGAQTASSGTLTCVGCERLECQCRFLSDGSMNCSIDCKIYKIDFGVAGGGTVQLPSGEAVLALSVSAVLDEVAEPTGRGLGLVRWVDSASGIVLESVGIGRYGPVGAIEGVREMDGLALVNGEGPYPFVLRVSDIGPEHQDTVSLAIGDEDIPGISTGISYRAEGSLVAGDLVGTWTLPEFTPATPEA